MPVKDSIFTSVVTRSDFDWAWLQKHLIGAIEDSLDGDWSIVIVESNYYRNDRLDKIKFLLRIHLSSNRYLKVL